jgi:hypothetical protein
MTPTARVVLTCFGVVIISLCLHAEETEICPFDKSYESPRQLYGLTVQITADPIDLGSSVSFGGKDDRRNASVKRNRSEYRLGTYISRFGEPKVWKFFDYDPLVILQGKAVASFRAWGGAFDYFESSFAGSPQPQILFTIAGNKVKIITAGGANLCSTELPDNLDAAAIEHFRTTATPAQEVKSRYTAATKRRLWKICVKCGQLAITREFRKEILRVYGKEGVL